MNDVEKSAEPVDFVQFARQRRSQIEAEAIDVHFQNPVTQAIHNQLQDAWMPHVQSVSRAGVIHVVARIVGQQPVIDGIINAPK